MSSVVVQVEVTVDFKEIPNAVVVIVDVKPIKDSIVIVVEIDGGVGEIAVDIAIDIVLEEVSSQFIGEVGLRAIIAVPLPNTCLQTKPGYESITVVLHLSKRNGRVNGSVATEVVVPATNAFYRSTAPVAGRTTGCCALIDKCIRASRIRRAKLSIDAIQRHLICQCVAVTADKSTSEIASSPAAGCQVK